MTDKALAIEAEAQAAIAAIRSRARAELFAELTPDQRKAAEALLGNYFEYEEPSLGQQIRRSFQSLKPKETQGGRLIVKTFTSKI